MTYDALNSNLFAEYEVCIASSIRRCILLHCDSSAKNLSNDIGANSICLSPNATGALRTQKKSPR